MSKVWAKEWLNENSQRVYPLFETATGTDSSGDFQLPTDFLVGLYFPVHAGLNIDPYQIFLRRIAIYGTGITVSLGYDDLSGSPPYVATAVIPRALHTEYNEYALAGVGDFADSVGRLVVGRLDNISKFAGSFLFDYAGGQLDPDCIQPSLRGIMRFTVRNGNEVSAPFVGDVEFAAGTNSSIEVSTSGGDPKIFFHAIDGAGLNADCICTNEDDLAPAIRTINSFTPDINGNFNILGSDCLTVATSAGNITFTDTCSQPCCGCQELEALTSRIEQFGDRAATFENFLRNVEVNVNEMSLNVLGSRLRDSGCASCN